MVRADLLSKRALTRHNARRAAISRKHALLWDDDEEVDTKENAKENARPPAPAVTIIKPPSVPTVVPASAPAKHVLPVAAVWGFSEKQVSPDWGKRNREVLNEDDSRETLPNKARLAMKSDGLGRQQSKDKARQRSLDLKFYVKRNKARRAARQQLELEWEEQEQAEPDGGGKESTRSRPRARLPREIESRRSRIRRDQRRAARDSKCFDYYSVESMELEPLAEAEQATEKKQKRRVPLAVKQDALRRILLEEELSRIILTSESKGPPVTALFRDGVMLSTDAVKDLQVMLAGQSVARALAKALSPPAKKIAAANERSPLARDFGGSKTSKAHTKKPMTKPVVYKGRGKRGA